MTGFIYSSLDKTPAHINASDAISLTPTLASQRLLAALLNEMLDTCEIDGTASVQEFADRFIGEPVSLKESALMMELYANMHRDLAQKAAQHVLEGHHTPSPEVTAGYRLAYLFYKVITQQCLGIGLQPFREDMRESWAEALEAQGQA